MACIECQDATKKIFARNLCQACYYRLRRNGTAQRINVVSKGHSCLVEGCQEVAVAKGLCGYHYNTSQHPLNSTWRQLRSRAGEGQYPSAWNKFDAFLADVGDRPSPKHQLRRKDTTVPHSKENTHWLAPITAAAKRGWKEEDQAGYMQAWNLKRKFGMVPETYAEMLKTQSNVCACCKQPETRLARNTGKQQALAVDHDHKTGAVRGLLCFRCNAVLGLVNDDVELLKAAAAYLESHAPPV